MKKNFYISKINSEQQERLARIETEVLNIKHELQSIKDNHLKTIYQRLEAQKNWLLTILGGLIVTLIASILNLIVK